MTTFFQPFYVCGNCEALFIPLTPLMNYHDHRCPICGYTLEATVAYTETIQSMVTALHDRAQRLAERVLAGGELP